MGRGMYSQEAEQVPAPTLFFPQYLKEGFEYTNR